MRDEGVRQPVGMPPRGVRGRFGEPSLPAGGTPASSVRPYVEPDTDSDTDPDPDTDSDTDPDLDETLKP